MGREPSVFEAATAWIQSVILGPVGTSLAIIAVASAGLLMLSGRINLQRGVTVILGCFVLFGASSIANGLRALADAAAPNGGSPAQKADTASAGPIEPSRAEIAADPYAGVAARR